MQFSTPTPKALGYTFPAEWAPHEATWLSYPHNEASFPGKIHTIYPAYGEFVKVLAQGEKVYLNVNDAAMEQHARQTFAQAGVDMEQVFFCQHPTNDAWCRDHGPAFVINPKAAQPKMIVNWNHNAWGGKYPYELDTQIPLHVAQYLDLPVQSPGIVMEGGAVDFNGAGTVLTTTACLLNPNRNPTLSQAQIEQYLYEFYGVAQVLWLGEGIVGDDTDGHIDDITRFVNEDTVITVVEHNKQDENYALLQENLAALKKMRLHHTGKQLNIVELPMPAPVIWDDQRLPASYANFYIANAAVIVPTFNCPQDQVALDLLSQCFTDRPVVGIDSTEIIWGLGSFHCLSQQEPKV
ncbi:agmatine deiminase family protein [Eisenibacter elegans]|jgi:agmatine deiminase|uniref:agmatine deiminase family protein n=1 Tax=Eisenibacter elegans TaxID=997 RepID=UPI00047D7D4B|nr:agmatine deiminase family protein [Eisenibacter elegans]